MNDQPTTPRVFWRRLGLGSLTIIWFLCGLGFAAYLICKGADFPSVATVAALDRAAALLAADFSHPSDRWFTAALFYPAWCLWGFLALILWLTVAYALGKSESDDASEDLNSGDEASAQDESRPPPEWLAGSVYQKTFPPEPTARNPADQAIEGAAVLAELRQELRKIYRWAHGGAAPTVFDQEAPERQYKFIHKVKQCYSLGLISDDDRERLITAAKDELIVYGP